MDNAKTSKTSKKLAATQKRIDESKLFGVIYGDSKKARTKSVATMSAQTTKLLQLQEELDQEISRVIAMRDSILNYSTHLWHIITLLLGSGCRISEVLSIRSVDIMATGVIRIEGKKGSNTRFINAGDSYDFMMKCRKLGIDPFDGWDRFRVYREFKRLGIGQRFQGKQNTSVTHWFRQAYSRIMQQSGIETSERSQALGHKSKKSIKHYSYDKKG